MRERARALVVAAAWLIAAAAPARAQPVSPPIRLLDVPYLEQSEALCGGAAAAMVMRYWGATGVYAETFALLVDRMAGGIRGEDLLRDLSARGWNAQSFRGDVELVQRRLSAGQPVIALIEDRPGMLHYVVIVAWANHRVIYHDPARAPWQVVEEPSFVKAWEVTGRWSLLMLRGTDQPIGRSDQPIRSADSIRSADQPMRSADESMSRSADAPCAALVAQGVAVASADHDGALRILGAAADACPKASAPWREIAGVHALNEAWTEAARSAREAVRRDANDSHAWRILATSRYVSDDPAEALTAWNAIGEPTIDIVNVHGLEHTRHSVATAAMRLSPESVLTNAALAGAARRLTAVPAAQVARVTYRPLQDGHVAVDAVMLERPRSPLTRSGLAVLGLRAVTDREIRVVVANPTGGGDLVSVNWRWWQNRPRIAASYSTPLSFGGVLKMDVFRDEQTYSADRFREVRRGGAVAFSDWTTTGLRWETSLGVDDWQQRGKTVSMGAALEQRLVGDRVSLQGSAAALGGRFTAWTSSALVEWRSSQRHEGSVVVARAGAELASRTAPFALWPGAGLGYARGTLLRAHPLLDDGVVTGEMFGRRLYSAGTEWRRWMKPLKGVLKWAPSLFLDAAHADQRLGVGDAWHVDAGVGVRIAIPGSQVLRIDVAKGLRDGKTVASIGWTR